MIAVLSDSLPEALSGGNTRDTAYGISARIFSYTIGAHAEAESTLGTQNSELGTEILLCSPQTGIDPRATIHALKDCGATHLWLYEAVASLSPLLENGDWLIPDDYIDGTRGQHYTYFSEKAGGYVQQVPPFDSISREALTHGAQRVCGRPFRRGVYVCVSPTRLETPAEAAFWTRAGAHVAGRYLSPYLTLARELDMQTAALVCVTRMGGQAPQIAIPDVFERIMSAAVAHMP
jgi:purine nucleoside phosphorylase